MKVAKNNIQEHGSNLHRGRIDKNILDEVIAGWILSNTTLTSAKTLIFLNIGRGGLIHSKYLMIMDFAKSEMEKGPLPLRILDHATYMYYLAFFIDKNNPKKKGKAPKHYFM